jgi:peptide/nickel transport system ATP-binding protein
MTAPHPDAAAAAPLLQVRDLRAYFHTGRGPARAVDGVSFDIRPGEVFALVGESGSGKSVTALSLLQLLPRPAGHFAGGSMLFEGRDLARLTPVEMRRVRGNRIAMIFQEPMTALNPVLTIGYQLVEALRQHRPLTVAAARARAVELLDRVGIPDPARKLDAYPHQLSGGMRQRVMIAMAVGCDPALLIADEPTTALDVTVQAQVFDLLRGLVRDQNTAVLLITHDMGLVYENADRVAVMYAGRIVETAARDRLFAAPAHPYTQLLLRAMPGRAERGRKLAAIEGMVPPATDFPPGCRFANRCPRAMPECRAAQPADYPAGPGHTAACVLLKDGGSATLDVVVPRVSTPAATEDAPRLVVRDLQVFFPIRRGVLQRVQGQVRAVDGVDLDVRAGETLALVGESGCGKTTVGKGIIQLVAPTGGSIRFHGDELRGRSRSQLKPYRRRIQVVFQDPQSSLNPRMMAGDIVAEGMAVHGLGANEAERAARVEALLEKVGLSAEAAHRYPHEFSGGQRQRLALARALAVEPELIVCDEATSSLDVSVQAQALNLLRDLQAELGLSYLFITHDMAVVRYLAARVAVMYLGRIVEEGPADQVLNAPRHPYTQALLSAVPKMDGEGRKRIILQGDVPDPAHPPAGCHFHPRCPHAMPVCREQYPGSTAFAAGHCARCWLHQPREG